VTGTESSVQKKSPKIGQVLAAKQIAEEGDRVLLAVNTFRKTSIAGRASQPVATPDALRLLVDLNVVVVPTPLLLPVWSLASTDQDTGKRKLEALHTAKPGIVTSL